MEKESLSERAIGALGTSAERLIGSTYAGFLSFAVLLLQYPAQVKSLTESAGSGLIAVTCIAVGLGIYSFYFKVLGEFVLFPFQHAVHMLADVLRSKRGERRTSPIGQLLHFGVPVFDVRSAYDRVRIRLYEGHDSTEVQIAHGEIHVLYITSVILAVAYASATYLGKSPSELYIYIAAASLAASLISDTRQHSTEAKRFRRRIPDIRRYLVEEGYVDGPSEPNAA